MPGAPVFSKEGMGVSDGELGSLSVRILLFWCLEISLQNLGKWWLFPNCSAEQDDFESCGCTYFEEELQLH